MTRAQWKPAGWHGIDAFPQRGRGGTELLAMRFEVSIQLDIRAFR